MANDLATTPRLPRPSPFALLGGGRRAFREVPRLRRFVALGFVLNYLIFAALAAGAYFLLFSYVIGPSTTYLEEASGEGAWAAVLSGVGRVVLWITQVVLLAGTMMLALLLSLVMMSLWFEALVARIVIHCRGGAGDSRFSIGAWLSTMGRSLRDSLRLLLLALATLVLGFVPVVGPLLILTVNGYLLGWEVRAPYLVAREERGDDPQALRRGLMWWTIRTGLLPAALALVPLAGWIALPAVMILLVAGFAWHGEQARRTASQ